jgi:hypothetical protein
VYNALSLSDSPKCSDKEESPHVISFLKQGI